MKRAQAEGISFSSVLMLATKSFVEGGLNVEVVQRPVINEKTRKMLDRELKEIRERKNISPRFKSAKDMIAHLNTL